MGARTLVVDRIEGAFAVLTDGARTADVPLAWLPEGLAEGWHLQADFKRDAETEQKIRDQVSARLHRLAKDDDGGDFSL